MACHNELRDWVADLAEDFTSSHVSDDPLIYSGSAVKRTKDTPDGAGGNISHSVEQQPEVTEQKGDLLIRDLWKQRTDSVHDIQVVNTDAQTHRTKDPERCLHEAERGKKRM